MATVGDLIVNLSANTKNFTKGIRNAQQNLSRFADAAASAALVGGTAATAGMIKLAADAETLAVKFRVLLKSGEAADAMLENISRFAASTPFGKMELAGAAQQLLAFNVSASQIMPTLRSIGDISALTGNRIGELAELYGKAQVQGRLFMEDINQLTGRGIPIIQELAKQFGVAESEVRNLVSAGKVSAKNLTRAFQDLTSGAGAFAGGMSDLSDTVLGKFSTLRDNFLALAQALGAKLLPSVNAILERTLGFVQMLGSVKTNFIELGGAVIGAAVAFKVANAALTMLRTGMVMIQALAGPAGWISLLIGFSGAILGSAVAANMAFEDTDTKVGSIKQNVDAVTASLTAATDSATGLNAAMKNVNKDLTNAIAMSRQDTDFGEFMEIEKVIQDLNIALIKEGVALENRQELLDGVRRSQSGFTAAMRDTQKEIELLNGSMTEFEQQIANFENLGISEEQINSFRRLNEEQKRLTKERENQKKRIKNMESFTQRMAKLQDDMDIRAGRKTAIDLEVEKFRDMGIGENQLSELRTRLEAQEGAGRKQPTRDIGIAQRGSTEAFSQIVAAMRGGKSPAEKLQKEANNELKQIAKNTQPQNNEGGVVLVSAGAV